MRPLEFKEIWTKNENNLSSIDSEKLINTALRKETIEFLTLSGLPEEASPFLTFSKNIDDKYEGISSLTNQYNFLEPEYSRYIVIGSDGEGNPIAADTEKNDEIEWLDHEDYFSARFMNSSIN